MHATDSITDILIDKRTACDCHPVREHTKLLKVTVYYWLTKIIPSASYCGSRFPRMPIDHEYQCWAKDYGGWRCRRLRPDAGWSALLLWQLGSGWLSRRQRRRREDRRHRTQA